MSKKLLSLLLALCVAVSASVRPCNGGGGHVGDGEWVQGRARRGERP